MVMQHGHVTHVKLSITLRMCIIQECIEDIFSEINSQLDTLEKEGETDGGGIIAVEC